MSDVCLQCLEYLGKVQDIFISCYGWVNTDLIYFRKIENTHSWFHYSPGNDKVVHVHDNKMFVHILMYMY